MGVWRQAVQEGCLSHPPQAPAQPLPSPEDPWTPRGCFFELHWPIRPFRKTRSFPAQPRISTEIETSFFRGPLLTSPSHISVGEWVPGPCSEERGRIHPAAWQVVPRLWQCPLSLQNVRHSGRCSLPARLGCLRSSGLSSFLGLIRPF